MEFVLAATLYVNDNGTFNDDRYEYQTVGLPFLRALGQAFYRLELSRSAPRDGGHRGAQIGQAGYSSATRPSTSAGVAFSAPQTLLKYSISM